MNILEQLAYCDTIGARVEALLAQAHSFDPRARPRPYEPDFVFIREPDIWSMPRPQKPAISGRRIFAAGLGFGVVVAGFVLILVQP